jgi:hypothetical protein
VERPRPNSPTYIQIRGVLIEFYHQNPVASTDVVCEFGVDVRGVVM